MKLPQMDSPHLNSYVSFRNQVAWSHHKLLYHTVDLEDRKNGLSITPLLSEVPHDQNII